MKFNRHILAQEYSIQVYFSGVLSFEQDALSAISLYRVRAPYDTTMHSKIVSMVYFRHDTFHISLPETTQTDRSLANPIKKIVECSKKQKVAMREEVLEPCYGLTHES